MVLAALLLAGCARANAQEPSTSAKASATCTPVEGVVQPAAIAGVDALLTVEAHREGRPISPYIYGVNGVDWAKHLEHPGLVRLGGNRWSAYNWENNASNAGSDWHHQNDGYLGGGDKPGEAVREPVAEALEAGAAALVTVPMLDRVAADKRKGGDVAKSSDYLKTRFRENRARKKGRLVYPPDLEDGAVYQDEFVHWLSRTFPKAGHGEVPPLMVSLDNEPALWSRTHARLHPGATRYEELVERSIRFARAVKGQAPGALVFGPVSYGWMGMHNLQNAPDAAGRPFLAHYLDAMRKASDAAGQRLLDVLDIHWYPEVRVGGVRVTSPDGSSAVARARLSVTRSLWDPDYDEGSWISQHGTGGPIRLIHRLQAMVAEHFPGTRLAITEYYFGGGAHITGALAQADALGVFGREGLFAAAMWPLGQDNRAVYAAFSMYRDYDGRGGSFGDRSVPARSSDEAVEIYASTASDHPGRVTAVVVHRGLAPQTVGIQLMASGCLEQGRAFRLTDPAAGPKRAGTVRMKGRNAFVDTLPPMSVTTYVFDTQEKEQKQ